MKLIRWQYAALPVYLGLSLLFAADAYPQQALSVDEIINSLQARVGPDESTVNRLSAEEIINSLQDSFRVEGIEQKSESAEKLLQGLPNLDLEIFFDYNSASIRVTSIKSLVTVGKALTDRSFIGCYFIVAGHTDSIGSEAYNQKLSEQRAQAVKLFLERSFAIEPGRLMAFGFGEAQLKDRQNPEGAINRRVQIINIGK